MERTAVERDIAERCAAAKLRLRFDKVVVRLVDRLTADLTNQIPAHATFVVCIAAPIRLPAKTASELEQIVRSAPAGERRFAVNGNEVAIRRVDGVAASAPRLLALVHNPESEASRILDLAEARLRR